MEGMTGRLFREFSMVISGAVVISTFAALTITPMLATKLLVRQERKSWFYSKTEPFFVGMNNFYQRTLAGFLRRRWVVILLFAAAPRLAPAHAPDRRNGWHSSARSPGCRFY